MNNDWFVDQMNDQRISNCCQLQRDADPKLSNAELRDRSFDEEALFSQWRDLKIIDGPFESNFGHSSNNT